MINEESYEQAASPPVSAALSVMDDLKRYATVDSEPRGP